MAELRQGQRRLVGKALRPARRTRPCWCSTRPPGRTPSARRRSSASQLEALWRWCLTKLDGTAKGGVIFALAERLRLPIRYVGIGEKADDLQVFNAREFTRALLGDFAGSKVDDDES
jgi:hypothetical protein